MTNPTEAIKERLDIVELIGGTVQLRKSGRSYLGFCPFHDNKRTPSFNVYPDTQSFHCFGCKASGTIFDFVMRREGVDFKGALELLAPRAGVELRARTPDEEQQDTRKVRLLEVNAAAGVFFHHLLVRSPRGETARAYAERRALDAPTIEAFQLGYAPAEYTALLSYLTERRGFEPEEVEAAGLAINHETRGYYDRFRDRLIFPIRNAKGEIIAFGGRAFGDAQPKYLNSPQTPLFDKSSTLYGLDLARDAIRKAGATVVVEGYVDVITAHQHGFTNVVAPLGTAITGEHLSLIKRLAPRVLLALDADAAGIRATLKGLQALAEQPEGEYTPVTSPRGVIGWQRSSEIEVRIVAMPAGQDPDEVIRTDPALWQTLIDDARPAMDFYLTALTADLDLHEARGKSLAVERLAPLIAQIASEIERKHYVQVLARKIDSDETVVLRALGGRPEPRGAPARASTPRAPLPGPTQASRSPVAPGVPFQPRRKHEQAMIGLLLRFPATRTAIEEKLQHDIAAAEPLRELLNGTPEDLFHGIESRAVWQAWAQRSASDDPIGWAETLPEELAAYVRDAIASGPPRNQEYRAINDALECATILQRESARIWLRRLAMRVSEASEDDADVLQTINLKVQLEHYLSAITAPRRSSAFTDLHTHASTQG